MELKLQQLKKAILYLKRMEHVRNNTDVAVALNISASYLSQMMHGNKPFTESLFNKFESHFKINLSDPFSYTDLEWVTDNPISNMPDNSKELFSSMKRMLILKDKETDNQKKIIIAQQQLINNLQNEIDTLRPLLK